MMPFYSIIVVCLNPGERLDSTIRSIRMQTMKDYEIVIKDGQSTDGALERLLEKENDIRVIRKNDSGIYDAMNQAVENVCGQYVFFLNCGDCFYAEDVLEKMAEVIRLPREGVIPQIYYGNIYERITSQKVTSNPALDDFGCYRNVPCHQACFYKRELLLEHPFETDYRVRADYEQFLWCYFKGASYPQYVNMMICDYEGGGFSESRENRKLSKKEHRQIVQKYMTPLQIGKYRLVLLLTCSSFRTWLARNEKTAGWYNRCKSMLYQCRRNKD